MYEVSVAGATLAACRDALRIGALTAAATIVVHPMLYALTEDYSDLFIFVIGTLMVHESLYYLLNSIILLVDAMDWLPYLRIPRKASNPSPPTSLVIKTLKLSALSHWIVQPISLYVLFPLFQHFGCQMSQELPPFTTIVVQIALSVAINDAGGGTLALLSS